MSIHFYKLIIHAAVFQTAWSNTIQKSRTSSMRAVAYAENFHGGVSFSGR